MLFTEKLTELDAVLAPEIDRLFQLALDNSAHENDLLLWYVNGFYNPDTLIWNANNPDNILNPHCIGFGKEGLSEQDHYEFIHTYRTEFLAQVTHEELLEQVAYVAGDDEHNAFRDSIMKQEQLIIQLEMLVYLKIWEADMFIKRFYELTQILSKKPYDWYFKVCSTSRDEECTGNRQEIIRLKIRDKVRRVSPVLYDFIKKSYLTQIRNSIAHSNYSFLGRHIHPNNEVDGDPANALKALSFDDWGDMMHHTMILYNQNIRLKDKVHNHFRDKTLANDNCIEVFVNVKEGDNRIFELAYVPARKNWVFKANL